MTRRGQTHAGSFPAGAEHPDAKLTEDMVWAIRKATGSHAKIGRRFGVAPNTVGKIKRRETWRHLPTQPPPTCTENPCIDQSDDTVPTLDG